jgi:hypothetical protein
VEVIVNEAGMTKKRRNREVAPRTRVQAGISTERRYSIVLGG